MKTLFSIEHLRVSLISILICAIIHGSINVLDVVCLVLFAWLLLYLMSKFSTFLDNRRKAKEKKVIKSDSIASVMAEGTELQKEGWDVLSGIKIVWSWKKNDYLYKLIMYRNEKTIDRRKKYDEMFSSFNFQNPHP